MLQAFVISRLDYCNSILAGSSSLSFCPLQLTQNVAEPVAASNPIRDTGACLPCCESLWPILHPAWPNHTPPSTDYALGLPSGLLLRSPGQLKPYKSWLHHGGTSSPRTPGQLKPTLNIWVKSTKNYNNHLYNLYFSLSLQLLCLFF